MTVEMRTMEQEGITDDKKNRISIREWDTC